MFYNNMLGDWVRSGKQLQERNNFFGFFCGNAVGRDGIAWKMGKERLDDEGASQLLTNCKQLELRATDGKRYSTDRG
jgi:hypothetical protein